MSGKQYLNSSPARFDPFSDRRSRDIRNLLSEAFVRSIEIMDATPFEGAAGTVLSDHPGDIYHSFTQERLEVYKRTFDQIRTGTIRDQRRQVIILWNQGLFFEVHELLESIWYPTKGKERRGLKGLIQAAGVYVHLEQGNQKAAAGLARRAVVHLEEAGEGIPFIANLTLLIRKLKGLDISPPKLRYSGYTSGIES